MQINTERQGVTRDLYSKGLNFVDNNAREQYRDRVKMNKEITDIKKDVSASIANLQQDMDSIKSLLKDLLNKNNANKD